jgi:elongation factor 1-beta
LEELECQIRNVHPAAPRSQKRVQQSSGAHPAVLKSDGATGAANRVFPTSARNADSGDREEMGSVAVIMRVMPESPEVDLEQLKTALKQKLPGIQDMKIEPIGFGLKAIKFAAIINDAGGETDALETSLSSIPGVERAEIIEVTLN